MAAQVAAATGLLKVVAELLQGRPGGPSEPKVEKALATSRESLFRVQQGAAAGASGRGGGQQGVDDQARAGALGVLGLRLLRGLLQNAKGHQVALEDLVPAVVACGPAISGLPRVPRLREPAGPALRGLRQVPHAAQGLLRPTARGAGRPWAHHRPHGAEDLGGHL